MAAPTNWDDISLYQKSLAPWEDSPNKGSRDVYAQNAYGWGGENLNKYILENQGDPYGAFDQNSILQYLASNSAAEQNFNPGVWNEGSPQPAPTYSPQQFTDFTLPQLQQYLQQAQQAGGNRNNNAMWAPQYQDIGGNPSVTWGQQNSGKGGLLDKITKVAEPIMMSLFSPFAGMGYMAGAGAGLGAGATGAFDMGVGGVGEAMGLAGVEAGMGLGAGGAMDMGLGGIGESMGLGEASWGANQGAFGMDSGMWNDVAQGWEGMGVESAGQNAQLAGNPLQQTIEQLKTLAVSPTAFDGSYSNLTNPMTKVAGKFLNRQDPLSLAGNLYKYLESNKNSKLIDKTLKKFQDNSFPHQNFYQLAQDYVNDPAKRYQYLKDTPGYTESNNYIDQAQARRNAKNGYISSGYGDALRATALGQNAASWDDQLFKQISLASGMSFDNNSTNAKLTSDLLPAKFSQKALGGQSLFEGIRNNQGFLPDIFKTSLT